MQNLSLYLKSGISILLFCLICSGSVKSQTLQPYYGAPTASVSICEGNVIFKAKILGGTTACDSVILSVLLPHGYNYVAGSVSRTDMNGTVTALPASADTLRFLVLGVPVSPDSAVVSFGAYADCTATDTASASENFAKYIISSHCMATSSVSTNTVNTQSAVLSFVSVTNNNYSGSIGGTFARSITISNTGFGNTSQIILQDTLGRGLSVTSFTASSGWTISRTVTVSGTDNIQTFLLTGPSLSKGQQVVVTENLKIVSQCYLQSKMSAYLSCTGGNCSNSSSAASTTAGATVNNSQAPILGIITGGSTALLCRGTDYTQTVMFTNIGTAPLTNFSGNIFSSTWSAVSSTQYFNATRSYASGGQSAFSNIRYKLGVNGTYASLPLDSVKYFTTPGSAITGLPGSFYFVLPQINPGDTFYVRYEERNSPLPGINSGNTMEVSGNEIWYSYLDACGNRTNQTSFFIRNYVQTRINTDANLPSVMEQGNNYSFSYTFSESNSGVYTYTDATLGSYIRYDLILPPNITFTGGLSDIKITKSGSNYGVPVNYSYNTTTNTISVTYKITSTFNINGMLGATLSYDKMQLNCAATPNGNTVTLNTYLKGIATCSQEEQMSTLPIKIGLACPVACSAAGGLSFNGFDLSRTNYGKPDNDNNGVADASGSLDFSKIKTNYALLGDTLQASFFGKISVTGTSPAAGFKYGAAIDTIASGYNGYFLNLYATIQLYAAGSSTPFYTCSNLPIAGTTTTVRKVDFSISALNSVCALPAGYTKYNNGDSVVVRIYYRVTGSPPTALTTVNITNAFGISAAAITTQAQVDAYSCGSKYSGRAVLVGKGTGTASGNLTYSISGNTSVQIQGTNVGFLGPCCVYAGSKPFQYEYRSVTIYDSASFVMPAGYDYVSTNVTYTYTTGLGTTASKTVAITPTNPGSSTLIYNIRALFENGTLPYGDQGSTMNLYPTVRPNCGAPDKAVGTIYIRQIATPGSAFTFAPYISTHADTIYLTRPKLTATATTATVPATTNTAVWEVQVANSTNITASSVWLAVNNTPGGVTITSVQKLSGSAGTVTSTLTPTAGGIYQLGNFGQTNAYYRITGTSSSCYKDSLGLAYWYDCSSSGYPANVSAQPYRQSLTLYMQPQQGAMQVSIVSSPSSAPHDLCEQLNYGIETYNTGSGDAFTPKITATLPTSLGIAYAPGTYMLEYPSGSGTYVSIPDANVTSSGTKLTFSVPGSYVTKLASNEKMRIRFGMLTDCYFVSGQTIRFLSTATSYCGSAIVSAVQQSDRVQMTGVPTNRNAYTIRSYVNTATQSCNNSSDLTTTYKFVLINNGPSVTGSNDLYSIELPANWAMNTSSVVYSRNPSSAHYDHTSNGIYYFTTGTGMTVGDSLVMTASLVLPGTSANSLTTGSTDPIEEDAILIYSGNCTTSGASCPVSQAIISSHNTTTIAYNNVLGSPNYVYGNGKWNGYAFQGTSFEQYKGFVSEGSVGKPAFDESFGGAAVNYGTNFCAVYTENFSMRYMMNQSLPGGSYRVMVGGEAYRFSTDGGNTWTINKWTAHAFDTTSIMINLSSTTSTNFLIEYSSTTGPNRATFRLDTLYVLPIDLQSFTGHYSNSSMRLRWEIGGTQPVFFVVERSGANNVFTALANVQGIGGVRSYEFVDAAPLQGRSSYRLRIVDQAGIASYSAVIPLTLNGRTDAGLLIFPTYLEGQTFYVQCDRPLNNVRVTIGDMSGRILRTLTIPRLEANIKQTVEGNGCFGASGVYTVFIDAQELNTPVVRKLMKR